jgi:hypothetical protein
MKSENDDLELQEMIQFVKRNFLLVEGVVENLFVLDLELVGSGRGSCCLVCHQEALHVASGVYVLFEN